MAWLGQEDLRPLYAREPRVAAPMQRDVRWPSCRHRFTGARCSSVTQPQWQTEKSLKVALPPPSTTSQRFWQVWLFHPNIKKLCFITFLSLPKAPNTLVCQKPALL